MTFDDGILIIYDIQNSASPGKKPIKMLREKTRSYYAFDRIGVTRYYAAKQANQTVEAVVNLPDWIDVCADDVCILQEKPDIQYQIDMVQPEYDENGLKITKLTLGRVGQKYEMPG